MINQCASCGSDRLKLVSKQKFNLYKCSGCGLIHKDPVLTFAEERALYEEWILVNGKRWSNNQRQRSCTEVSDLIHATAVDVEDCFVLDVGGGEGGYKPKDFNGKWVVADVLDSTCGDDNFLCCDLNTQIPLPDCSVNLVLAFDVLEHLIEPRVAANEMYRVLKPGGTVIIETGVYDSGIGPFLAGWNWWYFRVKEHKIFWNEKSLMRLFAESGFLVTTKIGYHKGLFPYRNFRNLWMFFKLVLGLDNKFKSKDHIQLIGVRK